MVQKTIIRILNMFQDVVIIWGMEYKKIKKLLQDILKKQQKKVIIMHSMNQEGIIKIWERYKNIQKKQSKHFNCL